ncbi:MAG: hydrolase [Candidatus Fimivivens sp.]|nr:hydrolase [Candidatus Fimivivens sp.]
MRLTQNNCCALVIDFQEKLMPAMLGRDELQKNVVKLLKGLSLLEIPMLITEQYPKGLGTTLPEITQAAEGAPIIEKTVFGALGANDVLGHLEQLEQFGRKQVLICGIEAHICVLQTALQLLDKGFSPIFVTDCIASRHQPDLMAAFMRAEREGVQFVSTEMVLFEIMGSKEHPQFKAISSLIK